jgi:hypothetical protein
LPPSLVSSGRKATGREEFDWRDKKKLRIIWVRIVCALAEIWSGYLENTIQKLVTWEQVEIPRAVTNRLNFPILQ